jgi:hypothetical protein
MDTTTTLGFALAAFAFIYAINATRRTDRGDRERDWENHVRDIAAEHRARGGWIGYRTDTKGRLEASTTSRTVPAKVALRDPDPVRRTRRWLRNHLRPPVR